VDSRTPTGRSESVNAYKRKHRNVKTVQLSTVKLRKRNRSVSVKENSRQQENAAELSDDTDKEDISGISEDEDPDFDPTDYDDRGEKKSDKWKLDLKTCDICFNRVKGAKAFDVHMFEIHDHGKICDQCDEPSESYQEYEEHMSIHLLKCDICDITLVGLKQFRRHQHDKHETYNMDKEVLREVKMVNCNICGLLLKKSSVAVHLSRIHSKRPMAFNCDKCEYETNVESYLTHHKRSHVQKLQECPVCKQQVKFLNKHISRGICVNQKESVPCEECGKTFFDKAGLKRHVKQVHRKIKDNQCDQCEYATFTLFNLKLHKSKMHTKVPLEETCEICNKQTMSIEYHKKTYHLD